MGTRLGSQHLGTYGWLRLLIAAALVLVFVLTLEAGPAAGAPARACRVTNASTGRSYETLQAAVKAARPGSRLIVKGTCVGRTVIDKSLVIQGVRTARSGKPKLSGVRSPVAARHVPVRRTRRHSGWPSHGETVGRWPGDHRVHRRSALADRERCSSETVGPSRAVYGYGGDDSDGDPAAE